MALRISSSKIGERAIEREAAGPRWGWRNRNGFTDLAIDCEDRWIRIRRQSRREGNQIAEPRNVRDFPDTRLPGKSNDDGFATIFDGELCFRCVGGGRRAAANGQQIGQLDGAEQLWDEIARKTAEKIVRVELILGGVGGAATGSKPDQSSRPSML